MTIRIALDSDELSVFSAPCNIILVYSDLIDDAAGFERAHPGKQVAYIDRGMGDPGNKATVADVERYALRVADLAEWYDRKAAARLPYLTYYCDRSTLGSVQAVIGGRHMWRWIATLDGTIAIPGFVPLQGPELVQCLPSSMIGIHADLSLVLSPSWRPSPVSEDLAAALAGCQNTARDLASAAAALAAVQAKLRQL
jgi:hypothetical protein